MAGRFSVEATFKAIDRVTRPVSRMQNRVNKFTRSMNSGLRKANRTLDKTIRGFKRGAVVVAAASAIFIAAAVNIIRAGGGFEQAITNVGAVAKKTRDEIAPLEQMAKQLGKTTKFTATEAANAMEILSRAGFNTNQILATTPAILSGAAAAGIEIAEMANHVSNVLKGMGLEMSESTRVVDVLALASSRTNSTIASLGESMKNVSSTARMLKIPLEDAVAAVALLQDVGLDASIAGTATNTMLTKMAAPTAAMAKKMRRFGISFKDAKGDMLPFQKVIEQLSIATKKSGGNFDKVAFLAELVGLRGQKAASNLAMLFETGKLEKLITELDKAQGSAKEMADIRMDTFFGSLTLLKSAVDGVKISIFDLNQGPMKDLADNITEWIGLNEELIVQNVQLFITKVAGAIGFLVKHKDGIMFVVGALVALAVVLKVVTVLMTVLNLLMIPVTGLVGLIALAVVAAVASFIALVHWVDNIAAAFGRMPKIIRLLLAPLDLFVQAIKFIKDNWSSITGAVGKVFGIDPAEGDDGGDSVGSPQVNSPQSRTARFIQENNSTSKSEVTIRDETGRAALTGGKLGNGLTLAPSGAL